MADFSARDFPRPDLGPNNGPFQFKNEQKLPKMVNYYIIPNFLVLHFGENFMKIRSKMFSFTIYAIFQEFL